MYHAVFQRVFPISNDIFDVVLYVRKHCFPNEKKHKKHHKEMVIVELRFQRLRLGNLSEFHRKSYMSLQDFSWSMGSICADLKGSHSTNFVENLKNPHPRHNGHSFPGVREITRT